MSLITILLLFDVFLTAVIVAGVIAFLNHKNQHTKQLENATNKIVDLQSQLTVAIKEAGKGKADSKTNVLVTTAFTHMSEGIIVIDTNGTIALFNPYTERFTGKFQTEVLQRPLKDIFYLTDMADQPAYDAVDRGLKGEAVPFERWTFVSTKNGKSPITGIVSPLLPSDGFSGAIIRFSEAKADYEKEQNQKAFFSAAAHELRSPISTVAAVVALLIDDLEKMPKEKVRELLTNTQSYLQQLNGVINEFLSAARIEQNRISIHKEQFNILQVTEDVIKKQQLLASEKKLYLTHQTTDLARQTVIGDVEKTKELLTNLISNAIKYTHQGGVTVSHMLSEGRCLTKVSDTGTGIAPQYQGLLFRKFQQIGTAKQQGTSKSTGLGLYIAKTLATMMGGDIMLEKSEPGKGSTFSFWLPIAPTPLS